MKEPICETLVPRWRGPVIVAATGKSFTEEVAEQCVNSGCPIVAVKQAVFRVPSANVLYACDAWWWDKFSGCAQFLGEKWSSHHHRFDPKLEAAKKYRLHLVAGEKFPGFSVDPCRVHYGNNTGFAAINCAFHWISDTKKRVIAVGFDMQGGYFYGDHPLGKRYGRQWVDYLPNFKNAAKTMPSDWELIIGTPNSLLSQFFPTMTLGEAL